MVAVDDSLVTQGAKTFRGVNSNSLEPTEVGPGTFIGDVNNLYKAESNAKSAMVVESVTDVECFIISAKDFTFFVDTYPASVLHRLASPSALADPTRAPSPHALAPSVNCRACCSSSWTILLCLGSTPRSTPARTGT